MVGSLHTSPPDGAVVGASVGGCVGGEVAAVGGAVGAGEIVCCPTRRLLKLPQVQPIVAVDPSVGAVQSALRLVANPPVMTPCCETAVWEQVRMGAARSARGPPHCEATVGLKFPPSISRKVDSTLVTVIR